MPIGGGRLLFVFCYQKTTKIKSQCLGQITTNIFFSIEIYKTICHTLSEAMLGLFFDTVREGAWGTASSLKSVAGYCFCWCSYFGFNESTLWLSWLRNSSPKKRHTQINHSNEHSRPLSQYARTRLHAWGVIAIAIAISVGCCHLAWWSFRAANYWKY